MTADEGDRPSPVCVLGHHEPDYPRNQVLQEALRRGGRDVVVCHSRIPFPFRHLSLAAQYLRVHRRVRVVLVTEGGHRLVPLVKALALATGRRVIFDPFTSRYGTRVEDRGLHRPGTYQAVVSWLQDWSSTHAADFLIFDTDQHRLYFYERYGLRKDYAVIPVGVPEDLFHPADPPARPEGGPLRVLFYGTYIPLQGVDTIVRAAAILAGDMDVAITLIGRGQTYGEVRALAEGLGIAGGPLLFEEPVPFGDLPGRIAASDLCLGIFGRTDKALRVVPNKIVQAAAMGAAMITGDTAAIRDRFRHGESVHLVPPSDPEALAGAIRALGADPDLRARLGRGARAVYEAHFSTEAISRALCAAVGRAEADRRRAT